MKGRIALPAGVTLPRGRRDVVRQIAMFALAYGGYELVRGLVSDEGDKPFVDAGRIINFERGLHVFWEPSIQAWTIRHAGWLVDICDWTYVNAHFMVTLGALMFIYLRRNESFYFVRNMFMVAMGIALLGYAVFPTAPPRMMHQWGFVDTVQQATGVTIQHGISGVLFNAYAAVPSMHVCCALMVALPMARLVRSRVWRVVWLAYPLFIVFVVVVTGNHYFTDVFLGALTAGTAALLSEQLLARARPAAWAFSGVASGQPVSI